MIPANTAAFKFSDYKILSFSLSHAMTENGDEATVKIDFEPSGQYNKTTGEFLLVLNVRGDLEPNKEEVIRLKSTATFAFEAGTPLESIPDFFYMNAIAIFFPYVRAFISTVSLQSNGPVMVLSLLNLSNLEAPLKANTKNVD